MQPTYDIYYGVDDATVFRYGGKLYATSRGVFHQPSLVELPSGVFLSIDGMLESIPPQIDERSLEETNIVRRLEKRPVFQSEAITQEQLNRLRKARFGPR